MIQVCSPFVVKYFNEWHKDQWKIFSQRSEQYQSLILSLVGKRGDIARQDFHVIQELLNAAMSPIKKGNLKGIEKSVYKQNRIKWLKRNTPMFEFRMFFCL